MDWLRANPHSAVALSLSILAALGAVIRFALSRHGEYVSFVKHMKREEDEVWPTIQEQIAKNHDEAMRRFDEHGQRLARVEARMPNGEIGTLRGMMEQLLERTPERAVDAREGDDA